MAFATDENLIRNTAYHLCRFANGDCRCFEIAAKACVAAETRAALIVFEIEQMIMQTHVISRKRKTKP